MVWGGVGWGGRSGDVRVGGRMWVLRYTHDEEEDHKEGRAGVMRGWTSQIHTHTGWRKLGSCCKNWFGWQG